MLNGNLLYAEHPLSEIGNMVEKSYVPVLEMILDNPGFKVVLNLTGFTLELLAGEHPDIYAGSPDAVRLLKEALGRGQVEVTGTSWAHMILPLAPSDLAKKDIEMFLKTVERVIEYRPQGFFPPELCISPLMPAWLKSQGYKWTYIDRALIAMTEKNQLNACDDYEPIPPSFNKKTAQVQFKGPLSQLRHAEANPEISYRLPSDYMGSESPGFKTVYLKSGSWSTDKDFKLWADDPDNAALNRAALEAYQAFMAGKSGLGEVEKEEVLRNLLLSFNSDGRGWVPIPEHRLFCFNKAIDVIKRVS